MRLAVLGLEARAAVSRATGSSSEEEEEEDGGGRRRWGGRIATASAGASVYPG